MSHIVNSGARLAEEATSDLVDWADQLSHDGPANFTAAQQILRALGAHFVELYTPELTNWGYEVVIAGSPAIMPLLWADGVPTSSWNSWN